MATLREKRPGVWEVRVFTGSDAHGRPKQLSRTVHGGKRDALTLAAELEVGPGRASPAGRAVSDVLDAWVEQKLDTWAPSSARDQQSRVRSIKKDQISRLPLARLSVGDVRAVMTAAATIDPAAVLALRIAAVTGARRAELAALQWTDVADGQLTIDSAIEFVKRGDGSPEMRDAATKTANTRTRLGHANPAMTLRVYAHAFAAADQAVAAGLGDILRGEP